MDLKQQPDVNEMPNDGGQDWSPSVHGVGVLEVPGFRMTRCGDQLVTEYCGLKGRLLRLWCIWVGVVLMALALHVITGRDQFLIAEVALVTVVVVLLCLWLHGWTGGGRFVLDMADQTITTKDGTRIALGADTTIMIQRVRPPKCVVLISGLRDQRSFLLSSPRRCIGSFRNRADAEAVAKAVAEFMGLTVSPTDDRSDYYRS